ncbi:hypothetical protein B566_EDAN005527 [Ephemera danica]|nr:hypothetical protein B566_EDAN005527 [Ephemera danica]
MFCSRNKKMPSFVRDASVVWRHLRGLVCVYKPKEMTTNQVRRTMIGNLCRDLNSMDQRAVSQRCVLLTTGDGRLQPRLIPSYADKITCVGPRYQPRDFKCLVAGKLGINTSGVLVLGINFGGTRMALDLLQQPEFRVFQVSGRLGRATDSGWADQGKATMRANFHHVPREAMERVLASTQASHQRQAFLFAGVNPQSQQAYEMASAGLVKPVNAKAPLIYSARCVNFEPPDFTLEVQSIGEDEEYLLDFVAEVGRRVRSVAACTNIRCIRHSSFSVEAALAHNHWTVEHIVDNMRLCNELYAKQTPKEITA